MLETSARLLRLLTLLQARATWSGADLAERLEVTSRTLRRDVDRLRTLGYPVESTSGAAGGYQLGGGASLPPLHLDADEATAVFIGLHAAGETGVAGADTASIRALGKLERALPPKLRRQLAVFRSSVLELSDRTPAVSLTAVTTLSMACSERRVLRFTYAAPNRATTERSVEPQRLVQVGRRWYLLAWDPGKDAWRTFRLDRIRVPEALAERFHARSPPAEDLVGYVTEAISSSPYRYRARVLLHAPIETLRSRLTPFDGSLEADGRERTALQTGSYSLDGLAVMVGLIGVEFEVISPPELVDHVRSVGARLMRAAGAQ